jgi:DNA-directed RNA polymerase alpha subunit
MNIVLNETEVSKIKQTLLDLLGKIDKSESILNTPICELDLGIRAHNICSAQIGYRFKTGYQSENQLVRHLIQFSEEDLIKTHMCGLKSLENIKDELKKLGLTLNED